MNSLAALSFFALVAYATASGIALGHGLVSSRGALEGALGGQWVPDVPNVASGATAKGVLEGALGGQWVPDVPVAHGPVLAAPAIAAPGIIAARGIAAPGLLGGVGLGGIGLGRIGLGGIGLGGLGVAAPLAAPAVVGHGISRGSLEGALGGQWIPDVRAH